MELQAVYFSKTFYFRFRARTSRGDMPSRTSWFIKISSTSHPLHIGIGEAAPLPGLSEVHSDRFEAVLSQVVDRFNRARIDTSALSANTLGLEHIHALLCRYLPQSQAHPAVVFAFETALMDFFHGGQRIVFKSSAFLQGKPIPINGLVWMGPVDQMWQRVQEQVTKGFRCIKIKVGAIDFDQECDLLHRIRDRYGKGITLRLDANGAFDTQDVYLKLKALSRFHIHSIEQPLPSGSIETAAVCANSPIPVALDEELIGIMSQEDKEQLLQRLKPAFIILKPTLHEGLHGCHQWIRLAQDRGVGWWLTSALESSVGLNAIAQFAGCFDTTAVQGLGTGNIYTNNFSAPMLVQDGNLLYDTSSLRENLSITRG